MRTAHLLGMAVLTAAIAPNAYGQQQGTKPADQTPRHERKGTVKDIEDVVVERMLRGKVISVTFGNIEEDPNIGVKAKYFIHVLSNSNKDGEARPETISVLSLTTTSKEFFDKCQKIAENLLEKEQISPLALKFFDKGMNVMYPTVNGKTSKPDAYGQSLIDTHYRMKTPTHQLFFIANAGNLVPMVNGTVKMAMSMRGAPGKTL